MSRKKIVAGNWKMNLSLSEATALAGRLCQHSSSFGCEVILFPPFVYLNEVAKILSDSNMQTGAQNCAAKHSGAFTGEVSAAMISSVGADYVLLGHSERRELFGETNEVIQQKLNTTLSQKMKVMFCCGEPLTVRENQEQKNYVLRQLQESLFAISDEEMLQVVIAYEPVWAIGTGHQATPSQAQDMHRFIRQSLAVQYGESVAMQTRILYGGSCKPDNARELFACPDVDGGLIGGASLNVEDFIAIIQSV